MPTLPSIQNLIGRVRELHVPIPGTYVWAGTSPHPPAPVRVLISNTVQARFATRLSRGVHAILSQTLSEV